MQFPLRPSPLCGWPRLERCGACPAKLLASLRILPCWRTDVGRNLVNSRATRSLNYISSDWLFGVAQILYFSSPLRVVARVLIFLKQLEIVVNQIRLSSKNLRFGSRTLCWMVRRWILIIAYEEVSHFIQQILQPASRIIACIHVFVSYWLWAYQHVGAGIIHKTLPHICRQ